MPREAQARQRPRPGHSGRRCMFPPASRRSSPRSQRHPNRPPRSTHKSRCVPRSGWHLRQLALTSSGCRDRAHPCSPAPRRNRPRAQQTVRFLIPPSHLLGDPASRHAGTHRLCASRSVIAPGLHPLSNIRLHVRSCTVRSGRRGTDQALLLHSPAGRVSPDCRLPSGFLGGSAGVRVCWCSLLGPLAGSRLVDVSLWFWMISWTRRVAGAPMRW
jgi:hypothetical protein